MNKKILIVEDDPIIANLVEMLLGKRKYLICGTADTGERAIANVAEYFPDLVIMDIGLKGALDGIFAAKYILYVFNIPVIFLTGNTDDETIQQAKKAEPFGFITKPFADKDLYSNIEIALYNHAMRNRIMKLGENPLRNVMNILDAVILVDTQNRIFFMNPYAEVLLGITAAEAIPHGIHDIITFINTQASQPFIDPVRDVTRENMFVGIERNIAIITPGDQKRKEVTLTARPLKDSTNEIIGAILLIHKKSPSEQKMARRNL